MISDASVRMWKPYPSYKDTSVEWMGAVPEHGNNTKVIFQTGLTGSTGYSLSFIPVILSRITKPQMNADERRFIYLNIQHFSEVYQGNSLIKSPQSTQRSQSSAFSERSVVLGSLTRMNPKCPFFFLTDNTWRSL